MMRVFANSLSLNYFYSFFNYSNTAIMRRILQLSLISLLVLSACNQTGKETSDGFTFAYLTDIHIQPEKNAIEGFQKAIDTINQIKPEFVLTGGDLVMDVLDQSYGRSDSLYKLYQKVSAGFDMPVYNTLGNHEIYGWHRNEEGITEHPEFGKLMFEKRLGDRYYSFDHKGWHFIVLDAISLGEDGQYFGKVDEEQIQWLVKDLEKTGKEVPIVVSVHIPFLTAQTQLAKGALAANSKGSVITNSREVLLKMYNFNLKLVLQGHLHFLEDLYVGGQTHFITAGAVSGRWWSNKPGDHPEEGFLLVHVNGEEFEWEYVDYGWTPTHD